MTNTPDHLLIQRAQQGDADAVATLYRRYVPAITRYVAYRVSDDSAVEDLTAEVFLRMVEGLPQYTITGAPFEAWLYRIAAARVADYFREGNRLPADALNDRISSEDLPLEMDVLQREELERLRAALQQLNDEQQTILILRFIERKSHQEVARILGKSERAIAAAQHRALKRLAKLLGTTKSGRHYLRGDTS